MLMDYGRVIEILTGCTYYLCSEKPGFLLSNFTFLNSRDLIQRITNIMD